MKPLAALVFALAVLAPAASAQTTPSFAGKWEGTYSLARPDGTTADRPIIFNFTQKGDELGGTAGPPDQQEKVVGKVEKGKATFDVILPQGPPFKFSLTIVKDRLQGQMTRETQEGTRTAKVDAGKAKEETKK